MNISKPKGILIGIGVVVLVLLFSALSCTSDRFTRISICTVCHEIFVDPAKYDPMGTISESVEDYKPLELFEPAAFASSVGCAECHAYPYEEYLESPHYENDLEVRPGCVGCHEPHSVREILHWKFIYINNGTINESPFHAVSSSLRDIPMWEEELRPKMAAKVRQQMIEDQSEKCLVCHKPESEWWQEIGQHKTMEEKGKTCIHCHYNLVHEDVDWPEMEEE
ncbi:hypothetical protein MNBD_GAMMA26-1973 [hydrothermal vent metagenome]|uniref:NapC/NirT cytochrome c N-terminal domain-containing protein n=1 Tax=hydrothermal vent metagenome TaxID=652676 RepID=A0A3B1BQJ4_9ZZZZ